MKNLLAPIGVRDVFVFGGLALLSAGAGMIYLPAALLVAGAGILAIGIMGVPTWH